MSVLTVKNLSKYFYEKKWFKPGQKPIVVKAVDDISFDIEKGEILGLLGPNGAGKTTTVQMLLGVLTSSRGSISYFGKLFDTEHKECLKEVNFSSAYINLPNRMTVWENLVVYARLYEVPDRNKRIDRLLTDFECLEFKKKRINQLSAGQKTRVMLTKAFINYPKLILLDEPTASLDPDIAVKVRQFLLKQQREYKVAMLFTSHNMHEVQEICDRIIFLNKGHIVAQDTPRGLLRKMKKTELQLTLAKGKAFLEKYLKGKKLMYSSKDDTVKININEDAIPKVLYRLSEGGVRYSDLDIIRPTLEDYFLQIVDSSKD